MTEDKKETKDLALNQRATSEAIRWECCVFFHWQDDSIWASVTSVFGIPKCKHLHRVLTFFQVTSSKQWWHVAFQALCWRHWAQNPPGADGWWDPRIHYGPVQIIEMLESFLSYCLCRSHLVSLNVQTSRHPQDLLGTRKNDKLIVTHHDGARAPGCQWPANAAGPCAEEEPNLVANDPHRHLVQDGSTIAGGNS